MCGRTKWGRKFLVRTEFPLQTIYRTLRPLDNAVDSPDRAPTSCRSPISAFAPARRVCFHRRLMRNNVDFSLLRHRWNPRRTRLVCIFRPFSCNNGDNRPCPGPETTGCHPRAVRTSLYEGNTQENGRKTRKGRQCGQRRNCTSAGASLWGEVLCNSSSGPKTHRRKLNTTTSKPCPNQNSDHDF